MHNIRISPALLPSPPPTATATATVAGESGGGGTMLATLFMALLLPCFGMCIVFLIYLLLLWWSTRRQRFAEPVKPVTGKGLSLLELEKLPKLTGKELALTARSTECAVCLEDIESCQTARLVPGCNHGFHQLCADTWLSNHTVCPVCRGELAPTVPQFSEDRSPC